MKLSYKKQKVIHSGIIRCGKIKREIWEVGLKDLQCVKYKIMMMFVLMFLLSAVFTVNARELKPSLEVRPPCHCCQSPRQDNWNGRRMK